MNLLALTDAELRHQVWLITEELVARETRRVRRKHLALPNPCIHIPSRCNGGGYDGCACGRRRPKQA